MGGTFGRKATALSVGELKGIPHDPETSRHAAGEEISAKAADPPWDSWGEAVSNAVLAVAE